MTPVFKKSFIPFVALALSYLFTGSISSTNGFKIDPTTPYPKAEREFRAAWVATVANINWPSKPGLPMEEQKTEAIELLNLIQDHNFNAVIFQVRPQCDALYKSELEPWSYYLTGKQGVAPDDYYDPLEFWVEEAHIRGLELHVWLNPYRAHHTSGKEVTDSSIVKRKPELAVKLKNGYWWLDPSKKGTQDHSTAVVMDIVKRYDIDGVHFDDYFYPYPSYNGDEDFPDDESWAEYLEKGGKLSRGDWRREGVNTFIEQLYKKIKKAKSHVKFGLSPFGIWRPGNPSSIAGFDQYDVLYADAKLWLNKGWIDYWTPQLYWAINRIPQSYPVLLGWWDEENKKERHLWPGISIGRKDGALGADETVNQIMITRGMLPQSPGNVHWSIGPLVKNKELTDALIQGPYAKQALIPSSRWLDKKPPPAPVVALFIDADTLEINWKAKPDDDVFQWVVYHQYGNSWNHKILSNKHQSERFAPFKIKQTRLADHEINKIEDVSEVLIPLNQMYITVVDRTGNESAFTRVDLPDSAEVALPDLEIILADYALAHPKDTLADIDTTFKLGIEMLLEDHLDLIKGKRVGLITNPSAVTSTLQSSIDALTGFEEVNLVALFGAEHGVRGAKQGKIFNEGEPDPKTGIPVYSMYGDSFAPKREWLDSLDVLLFDIQGVGSAWYTFKYSMSYAMEACAEAGIPIIILDRPNPLGGEIVEGPLLNLKSIFRHPLPLRHGMTYGELAMMWNDTEGFDADLTVIQMNGWTRGMTWDDTGLPWVMPSPNMGTLETAIVYPGQCLFERMNMSEARGTTKPFLMTGAPWVNAEQAAEDLNSRNIPGALFRPVYFIPQKAEVGSNPRNKPWNRLCGGVEIMLTNFKSYQAVETAIHIIDAYNETSPDSLVWSPPEPLQLLIEEDLSVDEVIEKCKEQVSDFQGVRKKYLLYKE